MVYIGNTQTGHNITTEATKEATEIGERFFIILP